jgi:1-acyl-sn-glycerol-3-phosphate acyltransferase
VAWRYKAWRFRPARDLDLAPGARLRSVRREPGLVSVLAHGLWRTLVAGYLAIWHRFRVEGRPRLPRHAPFVLVANHASHLDALALGAALPARLGPRAHALAADDVFFESDRLAAFAALALNALPLRRKKASGGDLKDLRTRLVEEPCILILFPEGTRVRDGRMIPFKPGVGMLVAGTDVPVVPCWIDGAFAAMPPGRAWPRPARLRVIVGEPRTFAMRPNDKAGWTAIAAELEAAVAALGDSISGR